VLPVKVPLVISNASANAITGDKCDRFVLRVAPSSAQVARPMGAYLAKTGMKNIFIMASDFVAPQEYVAVNDSFGESGTPDELMVKYGLDTANIVDAAKRALTRKK
jgi:pyruvate dehydrogenase complex dehydrogenase (E1) component